MSIYAKLLKAQREFPPVVKNAVNPHLRNKYADLGAVLDCVIPTLNANGLALVVSIHQEPLSVHVSVHDEEGGVIDFGAVPVINGKGTAQDMGSGLTYARRYAIATAFNLFADDDDDGNGASTLPKNPKAKQVEAPPLPPPAPPPPQETHKKVVMAWVNAKLKEGISKDQLKAHLGSLEGLDEQGFKALLPRLQMPLAVAKTAREQLKALPPELQAYALPCPIDDASDSECETALLMLKGAGKIQ